MNYFDLDLPDNAYDIDTTGRRYIRVKGQPVKLELRGRAREAKNRLKPFHKTRDQEVPSPGRRQCKKKKV